MPFSEPALGKVNWFVSSRAPGYGQVKDKPYQFFQEIYFAEPGNFI